MLENFLFDGAFGTYYAMKSGKDTLPERANDENPELVKEIHKEYILAGADIIRTNTFASNQEALSCDRTKLEQNLYRACQLAKEAVKEAACARKIRIAGDIGPLPYGREGKEQEAQKEYLFIAETLLGAGADLLLFETFSDYQQILPVVRQIKQTKPDTQVLLHFSMNQYGYTNAGISVRRIFGELAKEACVDGLGLNCGVGPGHMVKIYKELLLCEGKLYAALPNASYPKLMQDRVVFLENREYFVEKLAELEALGLDGLGGCCGTTPEYIRQAAAKLARKKKSAAPRQKHIETESEEQNSGQAFYKEKETTGKKCIAVELAPPFGADDEKVLDAAYYLKDKGVDVITFPDSPSGRTRADSILMGVKAGEKSGLCVMPHICCRDKNAIAVRSQLLGAYMNGIRNLLVVTGDPVPTLLRNDVKSVYNFDSVGLMRILQEMNAEEFAKDPIVYGGALNPARMNLEVEIERMKKKMQAGASFFLTQPLFAAEDIERMYRIRKEIPKARILCGIMPLVSHKNALFIQNEMTGIHVTDEITARYEKALTREEGEKIGIALAREIMEQTKELADGYYFSIPFNRVQMLPRILS